MLIAIDHGNKQVKTVHGNAIVSGVQKSKTRPYGRDVLNVFVRLPLPYYLLFFH